MTENFSPLIKMLLIFFIISLFVSICKNEVILYVFPSEYVQIARISSITSTVIGNSVSILLLFFIFLATFFLATLLNLVLPVESFVESSKNAIIVLLFGEGFKFFLIWLFLKEEVNNFYFESEKLEIESQLTQTIFYKFSNYSNIVSAMISILIFGYSLIEQKVLLKTTVQITLILSILLLTNILL